MSLSRGLALALLAASLLCAPSAGRAHGEQHGGEAEASAPALRFTPPPPGSYELPVIARVSDRSLLGSDGSPAPLLGLEPGQVALVSFVYLDCADATGCPLASATLKRVDAELARRPALAARTRLVSVSFDPVRDTPERMAALRRQLAPRSDWRFLTSANRAALAPLLEDFGQDAVPLRYEDGRDTGRFRHVLKLFLVDWNGGVRNVYSAGFLATPILLNDIETVLAAPTVTRR